jgi:hypothetical protein
MIPLRVVVFRGCIHMCLHVFDLKCSSFEPFFSFVIVVTKKAILPSRARDAFYSESEDAKKLKKKTKRIKNDVLLFARRDFNDDSFDDRCFSAKTTSFFFFIRFFFFFFVFRETIFSPGGDFR